MGNLFHRQLTQEELEALANADLEKITYVNIRDKREQFKLLFPFYRMDIKQFELQLNDACARHHAWASNSIFTEVVTVDALMAEFSQIKTIEMSKDRIRRLFKEDFFIDGLKEDAERFAKMTPD